MANFKYKGRTRKGKIVEGTIQAPTKIEAVRLLRKKSINARQIEEVQKGLQKEIILFQRVKPLDFVMFCRQLATLIEASVPLTESIQVMSKQTESKSLQRALIEVEADLRNGVALSEATAKRPKVFPAIFQNMLKAGEATGNIDETLNRLADDLEKQYNLKKEVQSALAYPAVMSVITMLISIFLLVTIVPRFVQLYEDIGADLPSITILTLRLSDSLTSYWYLWIFIILLLFYMFYYMYKKVDIVKYYSTYILLKMPIFGALLHKTYIARMTRTLSTLMYSAVPMIEALRITSDVMNHPHFSKILDQAKKEITTGGMIGDVLKEHWLFPPLVYSMVHIGEESGSLDYMLDKIAIFYEQEVNRTVAVLKSLLEPLMILILGAVVGVIMAAILIPMFSLYEQLS